MTKFVLALTLLSVPVARAGVFDRYFAAGLGPDAVTCAYALANVDAGAAKAVDRLAGELMLTPVATRDLLKRVRRALDETAAEGVVFSGVRRHRMFASALPLELRVIGTAGEARHFNPKVRFNAVLGAQDSVEGSAFLKSFGARAFLEHHAVHTMAGEFGPAPELVPSADAVRALSERLARDLADFEAAVAHGRALAPDNVFTQVHHPACRPDAFKLEDFAHFCLPLAMRRTFNHVRYAYDLAAGADSVVILKSGTPSASAWAASLREAGYHDLYSINSKGVVRAMPQPPATPPPAPSAPSPSPRVNGGRHGRVAPSSPPQTSVNARARRG